MARAATGADLGGSGGAPAEADVAADPLPPARKVTEAVEAILQARGTTPWVVVAIDEHEQEVFHQERPGRPNQQTKYRREVRTRYELRYELNQAALAAEVVNDGVFPLITNDRELSEQALLLAYKGQPVIERRFAQLKTEFAVAPVYLEEVTRIQALLCLYFLVLLVEALLERELRRAMARRRWRACRCIRRAEPAGARRRRG